MKRPFLFFVSLMAALSLFQGAAFAASTEGKKGLLALGSPAPDFSLPDVVTGKNVSLSDYADKKALAVIFICRHCPFVQHDKEGLIQFANDYAGKDVAVVTISANDPSAYPADSPSSLREMAIRDNFSMPVLYDETQETAKAYTAVTTPDVFLFDGARKLVYRGQFDDARPGNGSPVTGKDLRDAADAVLSGKAVAERQKPSMGCGIKWKDGQEPAYL